VSDSGRKRKLEREGHGPRAKAERKGLRMLEVKTTEPEDGLVGMVAPLTA
jgi:hypothetical protein